MSGGARARENAEGNGLNKRKQLCAWRLAGLSAPVLANCLGIAQQRISWRQQPPGGNKHASRHNMENNKSSGISGSSGNGALDAHAPLRISYEERKGSAFVIPPQQLTFHIVSKRNDGGRRRGAAAGNGDEHSYWRSHNEACSA